MKAEGPMAPVPGSTGVMLLPLLPDALGTVAYKLCVEELKAMSLFVSVTARTNVGIGDGVGVGEGVGVGVGLGIGSADGIRSV
jgi:hypothetical protein